jgi:hypothetical protein
LYEYAQNEGLKLVDKIAQIFKQVETDAGSLTQLKNQLVWWAVEVRAHEICNEREAATQLDLLDGESYQIRSLIPF